MAKVTISKLEKNHPIFTGRFETYTPKSSRHVQGVARKIPKWLLGRETLFSPKKRGDK